MIYRPKNDGITHINVYSNGKTKLGRLLSNFADTPFRIPFWGEFRSVEGFWYWVMTGDERLRYTVGFEAKQLGKDLTRIRNHPTLRELRIAYRAKLLYNPKILKLLRENKLPLVHYYVYDGMPVPAKQWEWTAELWNEFT